MEVVVHDDRVRADEAASSDADQIGRRDRAAVVEERTLADLERAATHRHQLEGGRGGDELHPGPDHHPTVILDGRSAPEAHSFPDLVDMTQVPASREHGTTVAPAAGGVSPASLTAGSVTGAGRLARVAALTFAVFGRRHPSARTACGAFIPAKRAGGSRGCGAAPPLLTKTPG